MMPARRHIDFPAVRYGDYLIERLDRNYTYRKASGPARATPA